MKDEGKERTVIFQLSSFRLPPSSLLSLPPATAGGTDPYIQSYSALTDEERGRAPSRKQLARRFVNFISRHLEDSSTVDNPVTFFNRDKTVGGRAIKQRDDRCADGCSDVHRACVVGDEDRKTREHGGKLRDGETVEDDR